MLTYDLSQRGNLSLYDYLYRCIKQDILAGHIRANERLPSKRQLATHLKISVITVEGAYAQLLTEGYIRSQEKRGYFAEAVATTQQSAAVHGIVTTQPPSPWFLDLTSNHLNKGDFPFSLWAKEVRRVLLDEGDHLVESVPYNGTASLREAIARYLHRFRGLQVHPDQVVVGAGTEYLYGLIVQLLGRERVFALEDPGYRKIADIYRLNGVTCRHIPVDGQGLSVDELLDSDATVAHLSPAHHFPSGAVMPVGRRQALLEWAHGGDRYLIEDDYDSEFRMSGRPIPPLAGLDGHGRVIYINTFSKSLAPSLRIAYAVLPPALAQRFREALGVYACTVPSIEQHTLARFLESGAFERHLARMKTVYRLRRNAVIEAIQSSPFGPYTAISESDAGLHFLLTLRPPYNGADVVHTAEQVGIRLSCLSDYQHTPDGRYANTLVINYSGADTSRLDEAIDRLRTALKREESFV